MKFRFGAIISIWLTFLIWLALTGQCFADDSKPIKIGAISVLTGEAASWGQNHQRGTILAMEEKNARGGIHGRKIAIIFKVAMLSLKYCA